MINRPFDRNSITEEAQGIDRGVAALIVNNTFPPADVQDKLFMPPLNVDAGGLPVTRDQQGRAQCTHCNRFVPCNTMSLNEDGSFCATCATELTADARWAHMKLAFAICILTVACKGTKESPSPSVAPPTKPQPAAGTAAPVTPPPANPTAVGSGASTDGLDAWCKARVATFDKTGCKNGNDDVCFCERGNGGVDGQLLNGPQLAVGKSSTIVEATIVRVVESAKDAIQCGVAARTAGGWHVAERVFKCGGASVGYNEINATIDTFTLTDQGIQLSGSSNSFNVKLAADGHALPNAPKQTTFKLLCSVSGASLTCTNAK